MTAEEYIKHYASCQGGFESVSVDIALMAIEYVKQEMKQQMMKDAVESGCFSYKNGYYHISCDIDEHLTNIKMGDKVKVIVIKE